MSEKGTIGCLQFTCLSDCYQFPSERSRCRDPCTHCDVILILLIRKKFSICDDIFNLDGTVNFSLWHDILAYCPFVQILRSCRILNKIALSMINLSICDDSEDFRWPLHHGMVKCTSLIFAILSIYCLNFWNVYSIHSPVSDTYSSKLP